MNLNFGAKNEATFGAKIQKWSVNISTEKKSLKNFTVQIWLKNSLDQRQRPIQLCQIIVNFKGTFSAHSIPK